VSDLNLLDTEIESDLRASVRDLLADRCPSTIPNACYADDRSAIGPLWAAITHELGLAGLMVPEQLGGAGGSAREAAVVLEELGRTVAPVPFLTSSVIAASLLLDAQRNSAGEELLAELASAQRTVAVAIPFSTGAPASANGLTCNAVGRVSGRVRSVAGALESNDLIVPVAAPEGISIYRVPTSAAECSPVMSLDMTRQLADITFDAAPGTLVVEPDHGVAAIDHALTVGAALLASEQVGVAGWCLTTTVEYLKQRRQFGRQLGSFQALKHRLAETFVAVETATSTAHYAAAAAAVHDPDLEVAAAVAQAWCGDVAVRAAETAIQLHGGIGMTWEHPAHLYLKRAKADQIGLGSSAQHRAHLATLVDLVAP
jgi:alkylation response protein AidB-like acyl-CoA dehydrogenase